MDFLAILSREFHIAKDYVDNIIALIDEGNTIPFIARYRKEKTGSCDDQVLRELADRLDYLRGLQKRREEVSASITEQGKMTDELAADIASAGTLARLEDIYRPYKQKRRTRATIAKERGLEPLAALLLAQTACRTRRRACPALRGPGEGGRVGGGRARGRVGHHRGAGVGQRGGPPASAGLLPAQRGAAERRRRRGQGFGLRDLLRLCGAGLQGAEPPGARHQPRRKGGLPQGIGRGGRGLRRRPAGRALRQKGEHHDPARRGGGRGRLQAPGASVAGTGDAGRPDRHGGRAGD